MSPWLSDLFLRSQSDDRLVALAGGGHARAFATIVERYRRALLAQARRLDGGRAEDLVQQTFLCAFAALQAGTEVRHLRGWLYQILRNLATRAGASGPPEAEIEESNAVAESAEEIVERRLLALETLGAVSRLPAHQHDALVQTAIQGRSRAEVADLMGLSEGAVRQLVHRARETLRTAVTALTPLPFARWLADLGAGAGNSLPELAAGAGAASVGIAAKVGAVVAAGVVATGVISAVAPPRSSPPGPPGAGARVTVAEVGDPALSDRRATDPAGRARPSASVEQPRAVVTAATLGPSRLASLGDSVGRPQVSGDEGRGSSGGPSPGTDDRGSRGANRPGGSGDGGPGGGSDGGSDGAGRSAGSSGGADGGLSGGSDGGSASTGSGDGGSGSSSSGSGDGGSGSTDGGSTSSGGGSGSGDGSSGDGGVTQPAVVARGGGGGPDGGSSGGSDGGSRGGSGQLSGGDGGSSGSGSNSSIASGS